MFELDERLAQDCAVIGDFPLSRVLLNRDANYPWFILVPRRAGIREIFELEEADQQQLLRESSHFSRQLFALFNADKLNIAALGNQVPQLHLHHIVRYTSDPAWPGPVWGSVASTAYAPAQLAEIQQRVSAALEAGFTPA